MAVGEVERALYDRAEVSGTAVGRGPSGDRNAEGDVVTRGEGPAGAQALGSWTETRSVAEGYRLACS